MIQSFKHKGLENYYCNGNKKGIIPQHASKIARILDRLDSSQKIEDMALPAYKLHRLSGKE
jgi:proteic killer suppression protein